MTAPALRTPRECLERAIEFKADAEQLKAIGNQWYAVSYFYAAYHTVRASLLEDPVFSDLARLQSINSWFTPGDRANTHHQARRVSGGSPMPPGVNDLVRDLYLDISIEYFRLHSASIAVRYGVGLGAYSPDVLTADFEAIALAAREGRLVA